MRVLMIEDEVPLAEAVARGLRREGYEVECAHDGLSGLKRARDGDYDAIILDILLPKMNGYKVCETPRGRRASGPRSSCSPPRTASTTKPRPSTPAPTTSCRSRSPTSCCSRACARCCGAVRPEGRDAAASAR